MVRHVAKLVDERQLKVLDDVEILKGELNTFISMESGEI